ncbi:unnamed protein product [Macrosiphum euphorbiae]|uniref:Uncharacterized protein n=1 Tax=Macrosiphum euphorbiae TaxID=13131 RepID=A0AAV0WDW6_9HEMI|nr:unnamed protein product [Macrosiphum euphorbiae]
MDFEFFTVSKNEILLVSDTISNSLEKYQPKKLEGSPLIPTKDDKLRRFRRCDLKEIVQDIKRVFRGKKARVIKPLLEQLYKKYKSPGGIDLVYGILAKIFAHKR